MARRGASYGSTTRVESFHVCFKVASLSLEHVFLLFFKYGKNSVGDATLTKKRARDIKERVSHCYPVEESFRRPAWPDQPRFPPLS